MPAESVGQIGLDLVLNQNTFERQMGGIESLAGSWAKKIGGFIGGVLTAGAIASFTKDCLTLGSDLNEVQNVVDVTFGEMSRDVQEWSVQARADFGLSESAAKEYVGTLGTMSKAMGFSTEKAYEQATALAGLSADVASFRNLSNDEAFTKLQAVYTGETEALKSLGVVMTQAALDQYALANGFGKTTAAMSEMEKVELRLAFVTDSLSDASGDFARTSQGWANQTRILAVNFEAVKAALGQGLINVLTPAIRLLNELVSRLLTAAEAFREFTAAVFGDAGPSVTEQTAAAAGDLAASTESAAASAKEYKKSVLGIDTLNKLADNSSGGAAAVPAAKKGAAVFSEKDSENGGKSLNILDDIKDRLRSIARMTGLDTLWKSFKKGFDRINIQGIRKSFERVFGDISDIVRDSFGSVQEFIQGFAEFVGTNWGITAAVFGKGFELISGFISTFIADNKAGLTAFVSGIFRTGAQLFETLGGMISGFFSAVAGWWESSGAPVWDRITGVFSHLGAVALDVFNNALLPLFSTLGDTMNEVWTGSIQPFFGNMLSYISKLWEGILALWDNVLKPVVDWIAQNVAPNIQKTVEMIVSVIQTLIETVTSVVSGIMRSIGGLIDFITGVFAGDWEKAWSGICDYFGGIWDSIWGIIRGVINLIIDGINKLWTGVFSVIQGIINGVGGLVEAIGEFLGTDWGWNDINVDVPTIPKLAKGGYVRANTPQLAVIGDNRNEGEIVAPESKIAEAVAAGISSVMSQLQTAGGGDITVNVELDGELLGSAVTRYQKRELMRGNGG